MIKVLHVIIGLNVGGAELMLKRLILNSSDDIEHVVVSLTSEGVVGNELSESGVAVYSLGLAGFLSFPIVFFRLLKIISDVAPDVVHTWMYHGDLIGGLAAYLLGKRNIIWCVRSTDINLAGSKLTVLIRSFCALLSHVIPKKIIYAADASRIVHEDLGYSKKKTLVIQNGFDLDLFRCDDNARSDVRSMLGVSDDDFLIGVVGRYHPVKDYGTMISAFEIMAVKYDNVKIVMVGKGLEKENEEFYSHIRESNYSNRYIPLGQRSDVPTIMASLDVYALHSRSEGFPNALGEAMLACLPCVSTDVGDAALMLGSKEFVSSPGNAKDLSLSIEKVVRLTGDERKRVGMSNRERIVNNFGLDACVCLYKKAYSDCCQQ